MSRQTCLGCSAPLDAPFLDLGAQPLANALLRPADLDRLLRIRENPTPRSAAGHLLTRSILKLAGSRRRLVKRRAYRLGAAVDRFFPHRPVTIPPDLAAILEQDWSRLLDRIGERRGRDFSRYARAHPPR